jgi:hypothetical protein
VDKGPYIYKGTTKVFKLTTDKLYNKELIMQKQRKILYVQDNVSPISISKLINLGYSVIVVKKGVKHGK